jgi:hypothetical protein
LTGSSLPMAIRRSYTWYRCLTADSDGQRRGAMVAIVRELPAALDGDTLHCIISKQVSISYLDCSRGSSTCPRPAMTDRCRDLYQSPTLQSPQAVFSVAFFTRPSPRGGYACPPYTCSSNNKYLSSAVLTGVCSRNSKRHPLDSIRSFYHGRRLARPGVQ